MRSYDEAIALSKKEKGLSLEGIFAKLGSQCRSCSNFYAYFHLSFITFLSLQLLSFLLFFSYFSKSIAFAFALAIFFLTIFSYFVLVFFFQTKKPAQLLSIKNSFLQASSLLLQNKESDPLQFAQVTAKAISFLTEQEYRFYKKESFFSALNHLISKCKIRLHWKTFHEMKTLLFFLNIEQITSSIKQDPTNLEAHVLLCETYVQFSLLFLPPNHFLDEPLPWAPSDYSTPSMHQKFSACIERAIEECMILQEYGEKNIWLYTQLATIYQLQDNADKEMEQYEKILELNPSDPSILFRLGVLYFRQGHHAKGLKVYEALKVSFPQEADQLIEYYLSPIFEDF